MVRGRSAAPPRDQLQIRDLLYSDLQQGSSHRSGGLPITISGVEFESHASTVVPGLTYHWASYAEPWIGPSIPRHAVVGERDGRIFLVTSPTVWSVLAHGWMPDGAQGARGACAELLTALALNGPGRGPISLDDEKAVDAALMAGESSRVWTYVAEPSRVRVPSGEQPDWEVMLWVLQRGPHRQVTQFRCLLPGDPSQSQAGVRLTAIDSIPLMPVPVY